MISSLDVDQLMQLEKLVDEVQGVESYGFEKVLTQRLSSLSVEEQEVIYSLVQEMKRGNRA